MKKAMKGLIILLLLIMLIATGLLLWQRSKPSVDAKARKFLYWVAPMNPAYRRDEPGKSPMGMDLVPVYANDAASSAGEIKISPAISNAHVTLSVRYKCMRHNLVSFLN